MKKNIYVLLLFTFSVVYSQESSNNIDLFDLSLHEKINVTANIEEYKNSKSLTLSKNDNIDYNSSEETLFIIGDSEFQNGTIELELAGLPAAGAGKFARGFIGVAFRIDTPPKSSYECFYLRPTNGRSEDQLRRNHSVQYVSHPKYTWFKLRKENPGLYESYSDLVPGEWTKVKIEIDGTKARLFLHGNEQPTLLVNDLKKGEVSGKIGLWIHASTIGYFRNLKITER